MWMTVKQWQDWAVILLLCIKCSNVRDSLYVIVHSVSMYNTERLNARRTIIRCSAYAGAVCTRTTAHSYSKLIKPAKKNFAWCDFTNFPREVFPFQVIWLKLKFVKLFGAKEWLHQFHNFLIFHPTKKFTWSDFTNLSQKIFANSKYFHFRWLNWTSY